MATEEAFGGSMKSWISAALAASALTTAMLAGPATAEDDGDDLAHQITSRRVTPAEIAAVFPKTAFDRKVSGYAVLNCTADEAGREVDCRVVKEDPVGMGFGEAALALVTKERVKTKDANGVSIVGQRFYSDFRFLAPGDANPDWLRKPTGEDLAAAFPTRALQEGKAGKAAMKCSVTIEGFLEHCTVLSESPQDYGFGAAALQLAPQFRMSPKIRGGQAVPGGEVTIPLNWGASAGGPAATFGSRRLMVDPPWDAAPSFAQVRAAWPADAKGLDSGQAALRCNVSPEGALKGCEVISEIPKGKGFGRAAKSLSGAFRIHATPEDAKVLKTLSVDVPFRFRDPAAPDTRTLTHPHWVTTLTAEGMSLVYPQAALKAHVRTGLGVVNCAVDASGRLVDCSARREDPVGLDFGAAALLATEAMSINPWTQEGDTVDGQRITLPVRFNWQPEEEPAKPPPAKP